MPALPGRWRDERGGTVEKGDGDTVASGGGGLETTTIGGCGVRIFFDANDRECASLPQIPANGVLTESTIL
ncbi:MAG: hypothetical protein JNJ70_23755 [Verrucomicrobiales bacterium]|nr:hypothetical protein [Verrucomicrobiales bacterium]